MNNKGFRPHQGIIKFNDKACLKPIVHLVILVSVPIRGLFNLTRKHIRDNCKPSDKTVSVPIRGLFNLTLLTVTELLQFIDNRVSVPIRGLFNLTGLTVRLFTDRMYICFRPHQGII